MSHTDFIEACHNYFDGAMSETEAQAFIASLQQDATKHSQFTQLQRILGLLPQAFEEHPLPVGLEVRILSTLATQQTQTVPTHHSAQVVVLNTRRVYWSSVAASVMLIALTGFGMMRPHYDDHATPQLKAQIDQAMDNALANEMEALWDTTSMTASLPQDDLDLSLLDDVLNN